MGRSGWPRLSRGWRGRGRIGLRGGCRSILLGVFGSDSDVLLAEVSVAVDGSFNLRRGRDVCLCLPDTRVVSQTSVQRRMVRSIVFLSPLLPWRLLLWKYLSHQPKIVQEILMFFRIKKKKETRMTILKI